jgi:hypothetical protein
MIQFAFAALHRGNLLSDPGGSRTHDLRIKSPLLYQLSYRIGNSKLCTAEQLRQSERNQ